MTPDPMAPPQPMQAGLMQSMEAAPAAPEGMDIDQDTFETMVAGLLEHLFGKAKDSTVKALRAAENPARTAGMTAFQFVQIAAKQAEDAGRELDLDMLLGVATEIVEALMQMAQAAKVDIPDEEQFMAEALFTAIQAYQATLPPDAEEQDAAKALLAQMQQDGSVDEGANALRELGAKVGVDPFAPQEKPLAKGVRAGLMGGGNA